jgi:predicted MFS family arabinose efflux permease
MGFSQLLPVMFALMTPLILARFGCQRTLIILSMAATAFMLLLAGLPNATAATVSFMAMAGLSTMMATARIIFSQESVGSQWRTTASAVSTIGTAIGWASAAVMGGILASTLGLRTVFFAGAVFSLLAGGLMAAWAYAHRQQSVNELFPETNLPATPAIPVSGKSGDD